MGGNSHGEGNITTCAEFNFYADPEAAKVAIDRLECPVCIAPLETCKRTNITWVTYYVSIRMHDYDDTMRD